MTDDNADPIDLTHPDDLDWMQGGGDPIRYRGCHSEEEMRQAAIEEIVRLRDGGIVGGHASEQLIAMVERGDYSSLADALVEAWDSEDNTSDHSANQK